MKLGDFIHGISRNPPVGLKVVELNEIFHDQQLMLYSVRRKRLIGVVGFPMYTVLVVKERQA